MYHGRGEHGLPSLLSVGACGSHPLPFCAASPRVLRRRQIAGQGSRVVGLVRSPGFLDRGRSRPVREGDGGPGPACSGGRLATRDRRPATCIPNLLRLSPSLGAAPRTGAACPHPDSDGRSSGGAGLAGEASGFPGKPLLALHPGASGCGKRWPLDRFQSVAGLLESSHDCLIIEGPAEPGLAAELGRSLRPEGCIIAESLPLRLLAGILSSCHAYLGNDSGISHLAAALGLRSVVIFGPTQPEQWAPSGPDVQLLRDTTGCAACGGAGGERHSCLENVTVERVRDCLTGLQTG